MDRVIALLSEKNNNLEKFYYINEQELINFADGNFDTVEPFYQARDKILDLISCLDQLLDETHQQIASDAITHEQRADISDLLRAKDELVKAILAQDLQLLNYIEKEKSNIIRELRGTGTARRAVGAYANTEKMAQMNGAGHNLSEVSYEFQLDEKP